LALRSPILADADPHYRRGLPPTDGKRGSMGRFAANIIVFVLNNEGYLIERVEENSDWSYNDIKVRTLTRRRRLDLDASWKSEASTWRRLAA
jgi:hypothetical protein